MKTAFITILILILCGCTKEQKITTLEDLEFKSLDYVKEYSSNNNIELTINYEYNDNIESNYIISQSIPSTTNIDEVTKLEVIVSKGKLDLAKLSNDKINELGRVPVMMYHGIINTPSNETKYTGGNVDKDGYQRTVEAFRNDLEFYYENGYRMIRLEDYINGIIDVEYAKSPIVLTFDDGLENNIKVTGLDNDGNIIIDPNSAVGVLEEFKKKYPDFNVTATFFLNSSLFNQKEYNTKIITWLVDNGYDIGNHTLNHYDFTKINENTTKKEVGGMYKILDEIIPNKYTSIVALPFGSPYKKSHDNFNHILKGDYEGYKYETLSTLRVGWEANNSPFSTTFDKTFIKRIRAWDNNGVEFDISMNFKLLEKNRYISDGDKDVIVINNKDKDYIINTDKEVIIYE